MKRAIVPVGILMVALGAISITSCSDNSGPKGPGGGASANTGEVGLQLQVGSTHVTSVDYTISNGVRTYTGTLGVADASHLLAVVGGIEAGTGYTLTLHATGTNGVPCSGSSAPFTVVANATVIVGIQLLCQPVSDAGSVKIEGTTLACANFQAVSAAIPVGHDIQLSASTLPATPVPPVNLAWVVTQGVGNLSSTTGPTSVYSCRGNDNEVHIDVNLSQGNAVCNRTFHLIINCPPGAPPPDPGVCGDCLGDPHLTTFDGVRYDMQGVGEFTLERDNADGFEVQIRTQPWLGSRVVSVNTAVAARVGTDSVSIYLDGTPAGTTRVNGTVTPFAEGNNALPGGGSVYRSGRRYTITWGDGTKLKATLADTYINVESFLPSSRRGRMIGLLGDFDGATAGDLKTRAGVPHTPPPPCNPPFYGEYVDSWRIGGPVPSLFFYGPSQSTEFFTDRTFPDGCVDTSSLPGSTYDSARNICLAAGVRPASLEACILDVGTTGDSSFAAGFAPPEHFWVDWTAATSGLPGTATGVITTAGGSNITVTYAGEIAGAQVNDGTNYWIPSTAYTNNDVVRNAPPTSDVIRLIGGNTLVNTITFSQPVNNPVMAILSLGNVNQLGTYMFDVPFDVIGYGEGAFGNGPLTEQPGNVLVGDEGHGVIQFRGTFTTIRFTLPEAEDWHGFQISVPDIAN